MNTALSFLVNKCSKCGITKPLTKKFYVPRKKSKTGFQGQCRECTNDRKRRWYWRTHEDRLSKNRGYREENAEYVKSYNSKYFQENKKEIYEKAKVYRENNREMIREYARRSYENNKEERRKRRYDHKRRSRIRGLPHTLTEDEWQTALVNFGNSCSYCGEQAEVLEQDHFIPTVRGGGYTAANIIPACPTCNRRKHTKDFYDWFPNYEKYSRTREADIVRFIEERGGGIK